MVTARNLLLFLVIAAFGSMTSATELEAWVEENGDFSLTPLHFPLRLHAGVGISLDEGVPRRYFVLSFFLPLPDGVAIRDLSSISVRSAILGYDADVHVELEADDGSLIFSEADILHHWGWDGFEASGEARLHKVFDVSNFEPPFSLNISIPAGASKPTDIRMEISSTDVIISSTPPNQLVKYALAAQAPDRPSAGRLPRR